MDKSKSRKQGGCFDTRASALGDAFAFGNNFAHNKDFWLGKNGKFYDSKWRGNI